MDTFFFVYVNIRSTGAQLRLGPYATLEAAAEIMVDCLPAILTAELHRSNNRYKASISEWMINDGSWEKINTRITEESKG